MIENIICTVPFIADTAYYTEEIYQGQDPINDIADKTAQYIYAPVFEYLNNVEENNIGPLADADGNENIYCNIYNANSGKNLYKYSSSDNISSIADTNNANIRNRYNTNNNDTVYNTDVYGGYEDNLLISNIYENILSEINQSSVLYGGSKIYGSSSPLFKNTWSSIENSCESPDFYYSFADNVNNLVDKSSSAEEKTELIHNVSNFSENNEGYDYSYMKKAADNYNTNNYSDSDININMGGITQNITEANCENVMDMLVESLMRGLSCKGAGVY